MLVKAARGMKSQGQEREMSKTLKRQSETPNGSHRNMASVVDGVGRNAIPPAWNIKGFRYLDLETR